jgi:hypothetical protein
MVNDHVKLVTSNTVGGLQSQSVIKILNTFAGTCRLIWVEQRSILTLAHSIMLVLKLHRGRPSR